MLHAVNQAPPAFVDHLTLALRRTLGLVIRCPTGRSRPAVGSAATASG